MKRSSSKAVALAVLVVFAASACKSSSSQTLDPSHLPSQGLFQTSSSHFDKVIRHGELPTVVNVWASWCIPCRREAPLLRKAAVRYEGRVRFLGLDSEDSRKEALEFIRDFKLPYASGFDPQGSVRHHLGVLGLPTTFFYRVGGETAFVHNGEIHADDLRNKLESLLQTATTRSGPTTKGD